MAAAIHRRLPAYVAAIDGPVHGDRCRGDPARVREAFIDLWLSPGGGADEMVADWRRALSAVRELDRAADLPVAYYGVSMGAAYGVALLAAEPSIEAAALGMWAQDVGGVRELTWRAPDVRCPIDFVHRAQDEFFTETGARGLFDALGSEQKAFRVIAGSHEESLEQIDQAAAFLVDRLRSGAPSSVED
jgi:dienelactone hydrolase